MIANSANCPNAMPRAQSNWLPNGTGFFKVPSESFRRLGTGIEDQAQAARAKLIFVALCVIANREGNAVFATSIADIGAQASVDRRTVERALPMLERLGLVTVERRKIPGTKANDLSLYTLTTNRRNPLATSGRNLATTHGAHAVAVVLEPKEPEEQNEQPLGDKGKLSVKAAFLNGLFSDESGSTSTQ